MERESGEMREEEEGRGRKRRDSSVCVCVCVCVCMLWSVTSSYIFPISQLKYMIISIYYYECLMWPDM